jgi:hypothetical protein
MTARSLQHDESPEPETAALVVAQRAKDHALDPGFVLGRFIHSSFVSRRHRFLYIETPKAACTKLKHFIAELEGVPGLICARRGCRCWFISGDT